MIGSNSLGFGKALVVTALVALAAPTVALADRDDDYRYRGYTGDRWRDDYGVRSGHCNADTILTVAGAVAGGVIGNRTSSEDNRTVATILGAVIGGVVGNVVGDAIDDRDRACIGQAYELGEIGRPVRWRNRSRYDYVLVPIRNVDRGCREFDITRSYYGRRQHERVIACRGPGGNWYRRDDVRYINVYSRYPQYYTPRYYPRPGDWRYDRYPYNGYGWHNRDDDRWDRHDRDDRDDRDHHDRDWNRHDRDDDRGDHDHDGPGRGNGGNGDHWNRGDRDGRSDWGPPGQRGDDNRGPRSNDDRGPRGNDNRGPRGDDNRGPRGNDDRPRPPPQAQPPQQSDRGNDRGRDRRNDRGGEQREQRERRGDQYADRR
jgi:surface antigen